MLHRFPQIKTRISVLADQAFAATFQRAFAFSLLYEDSEVDNSVLDLNSESTILAVAGAGCGVAGLLAAHPRRIDAVDTNRHHLALTAAKVAAAQKIASYEEFYQLFGHGWCREPARYLQPLLADCPDWIGAYWARNHGFFRSNLYAEGLTGAFHKWLRWQAEIDGGYLRRIQALSPADRQEEMMRSVVTKVRESRLFRVVSRSPLFLLGHGINYQQMQRNLMANHTRSMVDVVANRLQRIAQTDIETNWVAWIAVAGHFNHENPAAVPPYLREQSHARSLGGPSKVYFHNRSLQQVLDNPPPGGWSHFSLCDVLDWMPDDVQRALLEKIARRARQGAIVLTRSVEMGCIAERLGLSSTYTLLEPLSTEASARERTGLYGRVNVYRISGQAPNTSIN